MEKHGCGSWYSNLGPQNGKRWRFRWAMATALERYYLLLDCEIKKPKKVGIGPNLNRTQARIAIKKTNNVANKNWLFFETAFLRSSFD